MESTFSFSLLITSVFAIIRFTHTHTLSFMNPCPLTHFDKAYEFDMSVEGGKGGKALHFGSHPIYSARNNFIKKKIVGSASPSPPLTPPPSVFNYSTTKPFII